MKFAFAAAAAAMTLTVPLSAAEAATVTRYFNGVFSLDLDPTAVVQLKNTAFRGSFSYQTADVVDSGGVNGFEKIAYDALTRFTLETEFFEARWNLNADPMDIDIGAFVPNRINYFGALTPTERAYTASGIMKPTTGWFNFFAAGSSADGGVLYDGIRLSDDLDFSQFSQQQLDFYLRTEDNDLYAIAFGSLEITTDQRPLVPVPGPSNPPGGPVNPGPVAPVPEPATWAMMIGGFGMIGGVLRRRARVAVSFA